ncbi:glycoside hydrolase family 3 N-terminal domain-containing protein [Balneola sp. MJW-20]|uniref:glycoside hydrolase family 3 N-terminal domain-containing protein n=1 Tax=Gracilimonas aurantiaca TaxID=3234185 RepID=UPI0034662FFB
MIYKDPSVSTSERVRDLISRMTLQEKIGQMTQLDITLINKTGEQRDVELDPDKARKYITEHHIGSFLNGEAASQQEWHDYIFGIQKIAVEESRLGIPVIYGIDHMHGASYLKDATIFPHNLNLAATFDPKHAQNTAEVTVFESGNLGHHWIFAPVLDLGRNPKWPRFYETFGESAFLASKFGTAFVESLQKKRAENKYCIAATGKHFLGYSDPKSGWDRTTVDLSDQTIHEFHLPSFKAAIDAGLRSVMLNSGEINGIPVHASHKIITGLLREKLNFDGVVVTDWDDIGKLVDFHHTAENYTEAVYQSVSAGIDMSMTPLGLDFNESMLSLVKSGRISEERIDESLKRILKMKFETGLFEHPYPEIELPGRISRPDNRAKALEAAKDSLVLLKNNNNLLPLKKEKQTILLLGPSADSKRNLCGGWTISWQGGHEKDYPDRVLTLREALNNEFPSSRILRPQNWQDESEVSLMAEEADVIITAIGEEPYTEFAGNLTDLNLPPEQIRMIRQLTDTGKPVISIYLGGRPRVVHDVIDSIDSFIWAGLPGFEGAEAIAQLLSGSYNPCGRLPFSYPKSPNHFVPHNHKPSDIYHFDPDKANIILQGEEIVWEWAFGEGLSYNTYEFSELRLSTKESLFNTEITATVKVTNTGDRPGEVPVLWFIRDMVGSVSRPVKELKHFTKIALSAGESSTQSFRINPMKHLSFPDCDGNRIIEEGHFSLTVGDISETFRLIRSD